MARETVHDLAGQLSALLSDIDAAIRAQLQGSARYETRRRLETTEQNKGLRAVVVSALRWFTNSAEPRPMFGARGLLTRDREGTGEALFNGPERTRSGRQDEFMFITGWRSRSEVPPLMWAQVDFQAGFVRLELGHDEEQRGTRLPADPRAARPSRAPASDHTAVRAGPGAHHRPRLPPPREADQVAPACLEDSM